MEKEIKDNNNVEKHESREEFETKLFAESYEKNIDSAIKQFGLSFFLYFIGCLLPTFVSEDGYQLWNWFDWVLVISGYSMVILGAIIFFRGID